MKSPCVRALAFCLCLSPLALHAQTWVGGNGGAAGNVFSVGGATPGANWSSSPAVPGANGSLIFGTSVGGYNVGFNNLNYTANSLTFTSAGSHYFINGNGNTLSLVAGVTTDAGGGGVDFSSGVNFLLTANQTWTINEDVAVSGSVSGGGITLTKAGIGSLVLSGNNTYSGGTTISDGALYLGSQNNSSGTITVGATGTLGAAFGDLSLSNNVSLANGATLGGSANGDGSLQFNSGGTVTFQSATTTLNVGHGDIVFKGTLAGQSSSALTVHGTGGNGLVVIAGTATNFDSMVADNAGIAFATTLPTTSIGATNGGYVSTAYLDGSSPTTAALVAKITNQANFNGTLGFDTDDSATTPHVYSLVGVDLANFTHANFALGTATTAVLTGTINTPQANYNFKGFGDMGGGLFVQSNLTGSKNVVVTSPNSGGVINGGLFVFLQGNNTGLTGTLSVTDSAVVLDSATALPSKSFSLAANSYVGYTETASGIGASQFTSFANFAASATSYDSVGGTSIIGLDSHGTMVDFLANTPGTNAARTVNFTDDGHINLSANFSKIYLGTVTGVTIGGDVTITAPTDGVLRLINLGDIGEFNINTGLTTGNVGSVVVGMDGSEGSVALNAAGTYTGGTTLKGGTLLVGNDTALGSGAVTVLTGDNGTLALGSSTNNIVLGNNIAVTDSVNIGTGGQDDNGNFTAGTTSLELSGVISGTTGRLYITGPTTLSGVNTYGGGTYVEGDTTVKTNSALGANTGFVDLGYNAVLTVDTPHLSIGSLSDAGNFNFNAGTGNIDLTATALDLTINQTSSLSYSGQFTGTAANLIKMGGAQLTLLGDNAGHIATTNLVAGNLSIGGNLTSGPLATTATFGGDVTISGSAALIFRPGINQVMTYDGSISGAGTGSMSSGNAAVFINGANTGTGSLKITGGASNFTGNTNLNVGTLWLAGDNYWSSASATTIANNGGSATVLKLDGNQTLKNLVSGGGNQTNTSIVIAAGKALTVDSAGGTTFAGVISGAGGLTKTGSATFTLSAANTYGGSTLVSAGTLMVNGSLASSSVTVGSGAFLMGTGTLNDVTLNAGGTYRPGLSNSAALVTLDSLTMTPSSVLHMELGGTVRGTGYDALNINGAGGTGLFAVGGGTLSVSFINSFNPILGDSFNLFDFTSLTGTFGSLTLQGLSGGLAWNTSQLYSDGILSVTTAAIPEPSTYAMFAGLAVLGLAVWRRRSAAKVRAEVRVAVRC